MQFKFPLINNKKLIKNKYLNIIINLYFGYSTHFGSTNLRY